MGHRGLATLGPCAYILRAWHRLEGTLCAKPALRVYAVGHATQHPLFAAGIPVIRVRRYVLEGTDMRAGTMDVLVTAMAAVPAMHVLAVRVATVHAHLATRLPVIGHS